MNLYLRGAEVKWMEMLNGIADPSGWQVVHFHLDRLLEQYKSDYQIKIAVNLIHDLLKTYDGGVFLLADSSIAVMCRRLEKTIHNKLIFQLRYLYMDDPLAYTAEGQENPAFCTSYDLKQDWQTCLDLCTRRMALSGRKGAPEIKKMEPAAQRPAHTPIPGGMSVSQLAMIERDMLHIDLTQAIRRQPVCAVMPHLPARRVFDELYIHIAHLRQSLKSDIDFLSNRWLFKYLTQALDERMIDLIRADTARYLASPVSLNLNVETLLSKKFAEFDAMIKPAVKVSIVIEVPVIDIFSNMTAFHLARREAQKLGYRICLDGLTTASFAQINREKLGIDLLKMQWNADVESDLNTRDNLQLAEAIKAGGVGRVILCRCDSKQAVEYGQAMGISLFQGRYIDGVLNPAAKVEN